MSDLRFAMLGAGFWAQFQLAGWQEVAGARCVAVCDPVRAKAEKLAAEFGVANVYDSAEAVLRSEALDFVDIVSNAETHANLAALGAAHGVAVICQKPMAPSLEHAYRMVETARQANTPLLIHENWRWQEPLRQLKATLDSGRCGELVRARIDYANSFPVFDNQPFLKELKRFILTDIGTHILDVARFLFGEATELYCQTRRMRRDIAGEDVASVMMRMQSGLTVTCNMSYASRWEFDRFPETFVAVEGTDAGVSLGADYELTVFDKTDNLRQRAEPTVYDWSEPAYALIHSSIVGCQRNLLGALRGQCDAETTGEDNLKTLELVFGAYESADHGRIFKLGESSSSDANRQEPAP